VTLPLLLVALAFMLGALVAVRRAPGQAEHHPELSRHDDSKQTDGRRL
jgi:hypothetical protein